MLSRIKREGQKFFLSDGNGFLKHVNGVQDISLGYQTTISSFSVLGAKKTYFSPSAPQTGTLNINSLLFYEDVFYNKLLTSEGFSGKIEYKKEGVVFDNAHLVSYSSSCSIGEIPSISMQADIYGDMKKNEVKETTKEVLNNSFKIAGYNSINLTLGDVFKTNRVQSYALSASAKRNPVYSFNSKKPEEVVLNNPIEFSVNFNIEVDDYEIENMRGLEKGSVFKDISIDINDTSRCSEDLIQSFKLENAIIESESYSSTTDSNVNLALSLKAYKGLIL